jgi:hypothetical protein
MRFGHGKATARSRSVPVPKSLGLADRLEMELHFADRSLKKAV